MLLYKKLPGLLLFLSLTMLSRAQKRLVDSNAYDSWPRVIAQAISNNGNYLFYVVRDPIKKRDSLVIQSTSDHWTVQFLDAINPIITQNSKYLLFQRRDSLFTVTLGTASIKYQSDVAGTFRILRYGKNDDFVLFRTQKDPAQITIMSIEGDRKKSMPSPESYWYDAATGIVVFSTKITSSGSHLQFTSLADNDFHDIFTGNNIDNLTFSSDGSSVAFLCSDSKGSKSIWHYRFQTAQVTKLADNHSLNIDSTLYIDNILRLNSDNNLVFFTLAGKAPRRPGPGIDIWSYKDPRLQSLQLHDLQSASQTVTAAINISTRRLTIIEQKGQSAVERFPYVPINNWVILHQPGPGDHYHEWNWSQAAGASISLLCLQDSSQRRLNLATASNYYLTLSPDEKYVLYYDPAKSGYYSYEIGTSTVRELTGNLHTTWTAPETEDQPDSKYNPIGIAGFMEDNRYALIYDQNDIYKIDLSGKIPSVPLTNGYGRAHHIVLRVAQGLKTYSPSQTLILNAFNTENKDQGFYRLTLSGPQKPDSLGMLPLSQNIFMKARDTFAYLVIRANAASYPNLFYSTDLRRFSPVTDIHPEKKYNWLTSELVTWTLPNGKISQGVLYKPENIDLNKKFPLIIHYYERLSDQLHKFLSPAPSEADINIPEYVSNGYLVFTPDIHYTIGRPGRSAFECIVSAAEVLCHRGYVDSKRIGLQGTSFGGFETNYVITHTNRFAAAMSSSGMTDFISAYGSIIGDGSSRQRQYEVYRDRMGAPLSQIPDLYIENSPVLRANHITTPLLMMANKLDGDVPWQQSIEMFTALRRLGRKTWMLQYDGGGHSLAEQGDQRDLTIRVRQFFDYYLKNLPPPIWMTVGIPAERKGTDSGLELDTSGRKP